MADPIVEAWLREVLAHDGRVSLGRVAEDAVPIERLRDLARRYGLSPKGYRVERAPPGRLVAALLDTRHPDVLREVCELVVERLRNTGPAPPPAAAPAPEADRDTLESRLKLREQELSRVRARLARREEQAARQRDRESELGRLLDQERQRSAQLRAELERLRAECARRPEPAGRRGERRLHDLERELEVVERAEESSRRLLAQRHAEIRELQEQLEQLRGKAPRDRRRKPEPPKAPALADVFRLPQFMPSFYKSLEGKDRRSIEKAVQAVLLFCTEGPSYPGLEVKQIEGQDLWSLRASLKLRVYFRFRGDLDVEVLALADREDQHTTLRRFKER